MTQDGAILCLLFLDRSPSLICPGWGCFQSPVEFGRMNACFPHSLTAEIKSCSRYLEKSDIGTTSYIGVWLFCLSLAPSILCPPTNVSTIIAHSISLFPGAYLLEELDNLICHRACARILSRPPATVALRKLCSHVDVSCQPATVLLGPSSFRERLTRLLPLF